MPTATDISKLLDDTTREAVAAELRALAKTCRARDYSTEGIPMVLVLEDAGNGAVPTGGDPIENAITAIIGAWSVEALGVESLRPYDIATAFEVLAYRLLEPPTERDG